MLNNPLSRSISKLWLSTVHMGMEGVCLHMPYISKQENTLLTKGKGRVVKRVSTQFVTENHELILSIFQTD